MQDTPYGDSISDIYLGVNFRGASKKVPPYGDSSLDIYLGVNFRGAGNKQAD